MVEQQKHQRQTSLYLVLRADALLGALRFFTTACNDANRRRLQFLAQSDFWEWEIDNLIYSFTNLADRQKTWRSPKETSQKLGSLGIVVDPKLMERIRRRGQWQLEKTRQRVAPVAMLREVIETWNGLVELVEQHFVTPMRENAKRWNIQTRTDLKSLRKQMPQVELSDEDEIEIE